MSSKSGRRTRLPVRTGSAKDSRSGVCPTERRRDRDRRNRGAPFPQPGCDGPRSRRQRIPATPRGASKVLDNRPRRLSDCPRGGPAETPLSRPSAGRSPSRTVIRASPDVLLSSPPSAGVPGGTDARSLRVRARGARVTSSTSTGRRPRARTTPSAGPPGRWCSTSTAAAFASCRRIRTLICAFVRPPRLVSSCRTTARAGEQVPAAAMEDRLRRALSG